MTNKNDVPGHSGFAQLSLALLVRIGVASGGPSPAIPVVVPEWIFDFRPPKLALGEKAVKISLGILSPSHPSFASMRGENLRGWLPALCGFIGGH
mmetsp:Transcript_24376/g.49371  ORF Transcript_24376/g.49371 Transcript_24376/m.49371 type:complete len:95 (-) Transcript_24376:82-366(-)